METIIFIALAALVIFYTKKKKINPKANVLKSHYDEMDRLLKEEEGFEETGEIYYIPRFKDEEEDLDVPVTWDYRKNQYYPDRILKIDSNNGRFAFCDGKNQLMFSFRAGEVLSCRVIEDDSVLMSQQHSRKAMEKSMLKRRNQPEGTAKSLQLVVVVDREKGPTHTFEILARPMKREELDYRNAVKFAWQAFWLLSASLSGELPEDQDAGDRIGDTDDGPIELSGGRIRRGKTVVSVRHN